MDDSVYRQASDWLIRLREAPADDNVQEQFDAWLDRDPDHVRAWIAVSDVFDTIGETRPELEVRWRDAVEPLMAVAPRRTTRRMLRPQGMRRRHVLSGAVAAGLLAWMTPSVLLRLQSDYVTGAGEIEAVQLADGSAVRLGPNSAIAIDYKRGTRTVRLLAGQAWFDVKRDPGAPFRVEAGEVRTTVLGTGFDVRRLGGFTAVSVGHGRVRVEDRKALPGASRDLTAGQWVRVQADHRLESGVDNPAMLGAWREASVIARNRSIADVIEELRPWYGGRIVVLGSALGRKRVDGVYDAHDPVRALRALVGQAGGKVRRITPWLIVIS